MASSTKAGLTTSYQYNALGQRVKKSSTTGTTYFVYDEAGHLLGEYDQNGDMVQETVWMDDTPVATVRWGSCGLAIFYVHTDHLNTPRRVTKRTTQDVVWRWDSDPFGASAVNENPSGLGTFSYNLRFPGQYYDAETGLNYNYFRDYDPSTGRYVESDPIGLKGGKNTYTYAKGDPLGNDDPQGLLVRGRGCKNKGWKEIEYAEKRIRRELSKSCECSPNSMGSCIPCDVREKLLNVLDTSTANCGYSDANCGSAPAPGNYVRIFNGAFTNVQGCKCVALTLYHELLHNAGFHDPVIYGRFEGPCIGSLCNLASLDASD